MPEQIAPEYKEADRRTGSHQENTERARAGVTGHNVRYVLSFGLLAVIIAFAIVYLNYFLTNTQSVPPIELKFILLCARRLPPLARPRFDWALMPFVKLDGSLVFLCRRPGRKRP
jgi:hypothetical protein